MMPDGWRWRCIRRRLGTAVVCLLAVLGLAGCSALGLPVTGRMMSMPLQTQKTRRVFTDPRGPEDGAQPEDIVEGFVDAMPAGVQNDGYAVARQFLTSAAARSWKGDKKAVIYTGNATFVRYSDDAVSSANRQVVQMDIQVSGMLDSSGVYEPTDSGVSRSVSFTLRRTSKGWRISDAPSGVIVSEAYFDQMFRKVPLYRLASSGTELVPDVRWFPWRNWRTRAVRALLARAVPWLGGAVRNVNKAQVRLASSGVTIENDVPRVELTSEMSTMGAHDRALLVREIRLTLNDGDDQAALDIVVDGKSRYSDADENVTLDGSEDGESLYSLSSGHIVLLNASSPIRVGEVTAGTEKASGFVFAADGGALLRADGSAECLRYTGDSCGALFGGEKLSYIAQGDDGEIWALSRDGRTLHVLHGGVSATLSVPWLGDAVIESFAVSPEGSRLAVSVSSKSADGVRGIVVSGVVRDSRGMPTGLSKRSGRVSYQRDVGMLTFYDDTTLVYATSPEEGQEQDAAQQAVSGPETRISLPQTSIVELSTGMIDTRRRLAAVDQTGTVHSLGGSLDGSWGIADSQVTAVSQR